MVRGQAPPPPPPPRTASTLTRTPSATASCPPPTVASSMSSTSQAPSQIPHPPIRDPTSASSRIGQMRHKCAQYLSCCCGPTACRLCCQICPAAQESTSTKFMYSVILVLTSILMTVLLIPKLQRELQNVFRDFNATCIDLKIGSNCMKMTGYIAIYKVSFSLTLFFVSMCLLTIGVSTSKGIRACIHNGFWLPKVIFIAAVIVATFVIPISHLNDLHSGWMYATLAGNCLFILLQMICLIDSTSAICGSLDKMASRSRWWASVEAFLAIVVLSLWMAMAIVVFITHGRQEYCLTKYLIIIFNTGFCITLVLAALTPCARKPGVPKSYKYGGRLLQAGCVVVYVTYWTWSAMQSAPDGPGPVELNTFLMDEDDLTCHVRSSYLAEDGLLGAASVMMFITVAYIGSDMSGIRCRRPEDRKDNNGSMVINGGRVQATETNGGSASVSTNGEGERRRPRGLASIRRDSLERHEEPRFCVCLQQIPEPSPTEWFPMQPQPNSVGQRVIRNELWHTSYSYPQFHFTMALGTMFITTQLTRWFAPMDYQIIDFDKSWTTVGLKVGCSWTCGLIYLFYLLLPEKCCPWWSANNLNTKATAASNGLNGDLHLANGDLRSSGGDLRSEGTLVTAATLSDHEISRLATGGGCTASLTSAVSATSVLMTTHPHHQQNIHPPFITEQPRNHTSSKSNSSSTYAHM